eukprot:1051527-Pyramimonas_sp.AAC.1
MPLCVVRPMRRSPPRRLWPMPTMRSWWPLRRPSRPVRPTTRRSRLSLSLSLFVGRQAGVPARGVHA